MVNEGDGLGQPFPKLMLLSGYTVYGIGEGLVES